LGELAVQPSQFPDAALQVSVPSQTRPPDWAVQRRVTPSRFESQVHEAELSGTQTISGFGTGPASGTPASSLPVPPAPGPASPGPAPPLPPLPPGTTP